MFDVELQRPPLPDGTLPPIQRSGESDRIKPGKEIVPPIQIDGLGKIGLEICYDLRYTFRISLICLLMWFELLMLSEVADMDGLWVRVDFLNNITF